MASGAPRDQDPSCRRPTEEGRPDLGLSRDRRLLKSSLFQETFDGGRRLAGRYLVMWLRQAEDASLRLGVIASKRTFNRAADRNRAKRLMREAFRLNRFRFQKNPDVILVARRPIIDVSAGKVAEDLLEVAARAGLMGKKEG